MHNYRKGHAYSPKERARLFQQAFDDYFKDVYGGIPSLDKSFMEIPSAKSKISKKKKYSFIVLCAAVVICVVSVENPLVEDN